MTLTVTDNDGATDTTTYTDRTVSEAPGSTIALPGQRHGDGARRCTAKVTVPAAVQPGDMLLLFVTVNGGTTTTPPAGWALVGEQSDGTPTWSRRVYSRTAVASDAGHAGHRRPRGGPEVGDDACRVLGGPRPVRARRGFEPPRPGPPPRTRPLPWRSPARVVGRPATGRTRRRAPTGGRCRATWCSARSSSAAGSGQVGGVTGRLGRPGADGHAGRGATATSSTSAARRRPSASSSRPA